MAGKSILGLCKTDYGMLRGGTTSREREGSRWFGEEQAWENKEIRLYKEVVACKGMLVSMLVWQCPVPGQHSLLCLLTKLYFYLSSWVRGSSLCMYLYGGLNTGNPW